MKSLVIMFRVLSSADICHRLLVLSNSVSPKVLSCSKKVLSNNQQKYFVLLLDPYFRGRVHFIPIDENSKLIVIGCITLLLDTYVYKCSDKLHWSTVGFRNYSDYKDQKASHKSSIWHKNSTSKILLKIWK